MECVLVPAKQQTVQRGAELELLFLHMGGGQKNVWRFEQNKFALLSFHQQLFPASDKRSQSRAFLHFHESCSGFKWTQNFWMRELFHGWQVPAPISATVEWQVVINSDLWPG